MAHKKGVGSSDNGRDSKSKRLGVKLFGGQYAVAGNILVRQRGTKYHPGDNVYMGRDFTLHAKVDGTVAFNKRRKNRTFVYIIPDGDVAVQPAPAPKVKKAVAPKPAAEETPMAAAPVVEEAPAAVEAAPVVEAAAPVVEAPVVEEKPVVEAAAPAAEEPKAPAKKARTKKVKLDDLKVIEGIGPKIESILKEGGITTWAELAAADVDKIKQILEDAGSRYRMHNPTTWPKQAGMAVEGNWDELKAYQDKLDGGKE